MKELKPSSMYCSAFRWEFLVLDLPGSAPFSDISSLIKILPHGQGLYLPSQFLAFFDLFIHTRPLVLFDVSLQKVACLLPIMICFATLKHPLFALNFALFTFLR